MSTAPKLFPQTHWHDLVAGRVVAKLEVSLSPLAEARQMARNEGFSDAVVERIDTILAETVRLKRDILASTTEPPPEPAKE